jgi:hypothetical protein
MKFSDYTQTDENYSGLLRQRRESAKARKREGAKARKHEGAKARKREGAKA